MALTDEFHHPAMSPRRVGQARGRGGRGSASERRCLLLCCRRTKCCDRLSHRRADLGPTSQTKATRLMWRSATIWIVSSVLYLGKLVDRGVPGLPSKHSSVRCAALASAEHVIGCCCRWLRAFGVTAARLFLCLVDMYFMSEDQREHLHKQSP